ncbi:MAG: hypothetical protein ABWX56_07130 [Mycetocola sp.]
MSHEEPMNDERSSDVQRLRMFLVVAGVIGMIWALGVGGAAAQYGGVEYRCMVEGPFPTSPPMASLTEGEPERAYLSVWPYGRACEWKRADGQGPVTAFSDWSATGGFLACAAMAIAGGFFIGRREKATPSEGHTGHSRPAVRDANPGQSRGGSHRSEVTE